MSQERDWFEPIVEPTPIGDEITREVESKSPRQKEPEDDDQQ